MKTEYDAYAAFLTSQPGGKGTPLFYALMLRIRGRKSLATSSFAGAFFRRQIYTFTPENAVLLRNIPISVPITKRGAVAM